MQIPKELRIAVEHAVGETPERELRTAVAELTARYRPGALGGAAALTSDARRLAYAAVRMPATYAALRRVFEEAASLLAPEVALRRLVDLGAGPGTAGWAAIDTFENLDAIRFLERDPGIAALGRRFAACAPTAALREADWTVGDVTARVEIVPGDLVVASYLLGELSESARRALVHRLSVSQAAAIVAVEPGTPAGFATVLDARERFVEAGWCVVAPCPHDGRCPIAAPDWCHFAARVERSALHRRLKGGELGHEDEKYTYIAVARSRAASLPARIVRHPKRGAGYTVLELCTPRGLETTTVTRSQRNAHRRARKAAWGDAWEESEP